MIGLGLSITQLAVRQLVGQFNPMKLFALGEQGAWYDPSDLSTLYQDAAGTTPVTAVEQPVGLMLDKSQGLVLGPELVVNGDFNDGNTTGWVTGGTVAVVSGAVQLQSQYATLRQGTAVNGKWYRVTLTLSNTTTIRIRVGGNIVKDFFSGTGTQNFTVAATSSGDLVYFERQGASGLVSIDNISVRELPGNHAFQTTATSRPVLKQDAGGQYYLRCDGIDDWMVTGTITPGTDKAQVFAGVRKLSDATTAIVFELSATINDNVGSFAITAPSAAGAIKFGLSYRGTTTVQTIGTTSTDFNAPSTVIDTAVLSISEDVAILRLNGTQAAQSTVDQGTGNYLAYPLYLFRRGGTTLPFNGHFYGGIIRFGDNLPIETIQQTEAYMAAKTGVTL